MTAIEGKVAVVTGAASGIGRGIAEELISQGASVVLADIEALALTEAGAELGVPFVQVDVSSEASMRDLASAVLRTYGKVDLVFNNAGIGPFGNIADLTMADWKWMIDVNLYGVIHGVHVFLPLLKANAAGGHIINTSSMSALDPVPGLGAYAVTKCGVSGLTEVLAAELQAEGSQVKATLLIPGGVRTRIGQSLRNRPANTGALQDVELSQAPGLSTAWHDPRDVARVACHAVRTDELYAISHPEQWQRVESRQQGVRNAFHRGWNLGLPEAAS